MSNTLNLGDGKWATKEGSLLAYNSENNNYKPLPFTFDRASSATRVNKDGLIETVGADQPRVDYLNDSNGALKLEPSRTNLVTYSEDFSDSSWVKNGTTVTNGFISPDGTNNAYKLIENSSNTDHQIYRNVVTTNGSFSSTIFVKSAERSKIRFTNGTNPFQVKFDLSNGTIISQVGATGNIISMLNGWYKCTISWSVGSSSSQYLYVGILDDNGNITYQGNGSSGVYIWGAQLEVGSYPTSYIPTQGSAVTRVGEVCNQGGISSVINSTEGVLYVETHNVLSGYDNNIYLTDGTNSERVGILFSNSSGALMFLIRVDDVYMASITIPANQVNWEQTNKIAIKYKTNDMSFWLNGTKVATDTSGTMFSAKHTYSIRVSIVVAVELFTEKQEI